MAKLVTFETPDGRKFFHLTEAQKAMEADLFGPFAALGNEAAAKGMSYMTQDKEELEWPYWTIIAENAGGACTPKIFQQFMHWILMQYLSKFTPDMPVPPPYARPPLLSNFEEDEVKELAFKVGAEIIDAIVPDLAPDLFRMVDINDDGTISAEEWKKARSVITNPEPRAVVDLLFKLLDKDCSGTVEIDEVISFEKKLVSLAFRLAKTLIPLITTTMSTAMASEGADSVFQLLDGDGDGKLTPEEITNNFCGQILLAVNALGSAAPLLNEIRAKDYEIAFLEAQIAKLGGNSAYVPMEIVPEFELSREEVKALVSLSGTPPWRMQDELMGTEGVTRSAAMKVYASGIKLAVKMFMTVANLPMIDQHTKDTFYKEMNDRQLKLVKEVIDILRPILKAMPRDEILTTLDTIYDKMAKGEFDKERKGFTDALFNVIDVDKDGKISPAEYAVYTDLFFKMTVSDDGAKAKLMAIFNSLDLDKSGCLSKDELSAFMIKIVEIKVAYTLLTICMFEAVYGVIVDKAIKEIMDFYIKYRVENCFKKQADMEKIDIAEFNIMLTTGPSWLQGYARDQAKKLGITEEEEEEKEEEKEEEEIEQTPEEKELLQAAMNDDMTTVVALLKAGTNVNCRHEQSWTALHLAAGKGHEALAQVLLGAGANINAAGDRGYTPLHLTASCNKPEVAKVLLANGAQVDVRDNELKTPLHKAADAVDVAKVLVDNGAELNARDMDGNTALDLAENDDVKAVLRERGAKHSLFCAVAEVVVDLIKEGADVNEKNSRQSTPLHKAASNNAVDAAKVLVAHGAELNARDERQSTPLHKAARNNAVDVAKVLVDNGAELNARDMDGNTPLAWAKVFDVFGHSEVQALLEEHGGQ